MKPLHQITTHVTRQAVGRDYAMLAQILDRWDDIVGPAYARQCTPIKISVSPRGPSQKSGVLTLRAPRGLIPELGYASVSILSKLNSFLGRKLIDRLEFEATLLPRPPPLHSKNAPQPIDPSHLPSSITQQLDRQDDEELRQALENLALAVMQKLR